MGADPPKPLGSGGRDSPRSLTNEFWLPEIVVPAGITDKGLAVTISFVGTAVSDGTLIGDAYDFEPSTWAIKPSKNTRVLKSDEISY